MSTIREFLTGIANAIRSKKLNATEPINAQNFASEIENLGPIYDSITITENGNHDVTNYKNAVVGVASSASSFVDVLNGNTIDVLDIPYGVINLKYGVLNRLKIDTLNIPSSMVSINGACQNTDIAVINWPKSLNSLGGGAFSSSTYTRDKHVYYDGTLDDWLNIKFLSQNDNPFCSGSSKPKNNTYLYINNNPVTHVDVTHYVDGGEANFAYLTCLKSISFAEGLTKIPDYYCYNSGLDMERLILPEGITEIGQYAFENCKINELVIPSTCTMFYSNAILSSDINNIIFTSETPMFNSMASYAIKKHSNLKIYVPATCVNAYKTATNFTTYANYIYPLNNITLSVKSALVNNDNYMYSTDGGTSYSKFTNTTINLSNVATLKIKNLDSTKSVLVGTSEGGTDIGTVGANAVLTYPTTTDTTIYIGV